jgi:hypothetical protein
VSVPSERAIPVNSSRRLWAFRWPGLDVLARCRIRPVTDTTETNEEVTT